LADLKGIVILPQLNPILPLILIFTSLSFTSSISITNDPSQTSSVRPFSLTGALFSFQLKTESVSEAEVEVK
jgi:hypothetical protein